MSHHQGKRHDAEGRLRIASAADPGATRPPPIDHSRESTLVSTGRTLLTAAVLAVILVGVLRVFVVDAFRIPTSSMESTLLAGDFLLVNKTAYGSRFPGTSLRVPYIRGPSMGDVVVFHPPHLPGKHYVKRVIGMPGDTIEMRDGVVYINDRILQEPYAVRDRERRDGYHPDMKWQGRFLTTSRSRRPTRNDWGPIEVPENRFFVLGDNRDNSEDSRYWGFVERNRILGQPWFVYYSREQAQPEGNWVQDVRWDRIGELVE